MNKKTTVSLSRIILLSFVMLFSIAAISSATDYIWDNAAGDGGNWNTAANWNPNVVPLAADTARINMTTGPIFSGLTTTVYRVYLEGAGNGTLTVSSGTLNTTSHIYIAAVAADRGTLNMNGGAINIATTLYIARDNSSNATVNLLGGTITCGTLNLRQNTGAVGTINIEGNGKLIFTSTYLNRPVTTWIANGWIKAYNGAGTVVVDTTTTPGKTILRGTISDKAMFPQPTSGTTGVAVSGINLGWRAGVGADSHNVYLGTSLSDVNNAQRLAGDLIGSDGIVDFKDLLRLTDYWLLDPTGSDPYAGVNDDAIVDFNDYALLAEDWENTSAFKGNQDSNSFNPGTLAFSTTYYWRVDEIDGPNTAKGDVWNFTTNSGKATNVLPIDGDLAVLSRTVLVWTAATGATSHDVYFGTANPPETLVSDNQVGTTCNPGGLANSTTYYWRIDENYGATTVQGDVWSFRTMDASAEPDLVFVHATDPQMYWNQCNPDGIDNANWGVAVDKINQINPDFVLITGDLVNNLGDNSQGIGYQALTYIGYRNALTVPFYEVPGNHDTGEPPSASGYALWQTYFHNPLDDGINPWYSFAEGNSFFIGLDTTVLAIPFNNKDVTELNWLAATLADANTVGYDHIFVFTHYGYTADKWTGATALANKAQLSALFNQYHVTALFAGHTHYDAYSLDGTVDWVTERSCTCNLGSPRSDPGIGIIKVYADRIERESRSLASLPVGSANMKKGPYLIYPGNNTQMTVLWQVDASTSSCNIAWGTDTTYSTGYANTTEYGSDHQHKYNITGLTPGTKYYYRVKVSGVSKTGSFYAAPAADATNVKFFMYGDTRTNISSNNSLCSRMVSDYTADPAYQTMVLHAGDWVLQNDEATWTSQWFDPNYANYTGLKTATANMAFMGAPGNHEVNGDGSGTRAVYRKYWPFPFVASPKLYYSYDYGPVHITVLDQTENGGGDPLTMNQSQIDWLTADLSASTKPWKIIVLHAPGWSCGGGHINNTQVQSVIQPLCITYGVKIVLGGHNHYYSRAVVNGVQHITSGGGGADLYTITPGDNIVAYSRSLDVVKVAISGNTLTCSTVDSSGSVIDSFVLTNP